MRRVAFEEIMERLEALGLEGKDFDLVVAVARGGLIPGALVASKLGLEMESVRIHFKDEYKKPVYEKPKVLKGLSSDVKGRRILLVDDVSKTGATLETAKELLEAQGNSVRTLVLNSHSEGIADFSLFDFQGCTKWPWVPQEAPE